MSRAMRRAPQKCGTPHTFGSGMALRSRHTLGQVRAELHSAAANVCTPPQGQLCMQCVVFRRWLFQILDSLKVGVARRA
jgi:hypothetical protein